ncbi:hypothetical protein BsIDN1_15690 [Bacillus safensis]|uniref:Phosphatidylglycerol lysyltransferase C-terminal domain-containing protein n=1 Tax=Bacillus safensis TaxID=561879 RepID=A0A5S9M4T5_BACIA|nr:hypothetical protein BsIDN1_15690 [Bacillus safensis]
MLQFGRIGRCVIVLGDPSGREASYPLVLEEFLQETEKAGYRVAFFYQVEREGMALYHDLGFHFFKLGEEAMVDLETFTLSGKKKNQIYELWRINLNEKATPFEMLEPPFSNELISTLKQISDSWLGKKKKKRIFARLFSRRLSSKSTDCDSKKRMNKGRSFPLYH